jgi:hypothetical protein
MLEGQDHSRVRWPWRLSQATFISRSVHKPKGVESHEEDSTPGTLH